MTEPRIISESSAALSTTATVRRIVSWLLVASLFAWILWHGYQHQQQLREYDWHIRLVPAMLSIVLLACELIFNGWLWRQILRELGEKIPTLAAIRIFLLSLVARYLPGGVWQFVGRVYLAKQHHISVTNTSVSLAIEQVMCVVAALVLFLISIPAQRQLPRELIAMTVLIVPLLLCVHPRVLHWVMSLAYRAFRRPAPPRIQLSMSQLSRIMALFLISRLFMAIAFLVFVQSIYELPTEHLLAIAGIEAIAFAVGMMAPLFPGGLGLREGLLVLLLQAYMPTGIAVVISLASRVWWITAEMLTLAAVQAMHTRRRP